jgi:biotin operon repressor
VSLYDTYSCHRVTPKNRSEPGCPQGVAMPKVYRFKTRADRVKRETAAEIERQLNLYPENDLPPLARSEVLHALHRVTHPDDEEGIWPGGFTMISRRQTEAVWDAIRQLPAKERPHQVRHAFDLILLNLRQDTGEVMLSRDALSSKIGCSSENLSRIMGTLERMGVIRRERRKIEGVQGRGIAVYFINPHVAWNGSLELRAREVVGVAPPSLHLVPSSE